MCIWADHKKNSFHFSKDLGHILHTLVTGGSLRYRSGFSEFLLNCSSYKLINKIAVLKFKRLPDMAKS